jgi:hypothetical protein
MEPRKATILIVCLCVPAAAGLAADDGRIEIGPTTTFPIAIYGPGSYLLTTDLEVATENVNAIEIYGPHNVDLDLGGHTIRGPCSGTGYGITIPGGQSMSSVRVRNGVVSCFNWGLQLTTTSVGGGNVIEDVSVTYNLNYGIYASRATIVNCRAHGNGGDGINATASLIRDSVATSNDGDGIELYSGIVTGSMASHNEGNGIRLQGSANQVAFSRVAYNTGYGIDMVADDHNNVSHCAGSDNDAGNVRNCHAGNGCHHNMLP